MAIEVPYTTRPEDISRLLQKIPTLKVPAGRVDTGYLKTLGFSTVSCGHLLKILKMLGFLDEQDQPSSTWLAYVADERRSLVLASAVKKAYADLFKTSFCPYLEGDEEILDYLKQNVKASTRERLLMVQTFRNLSEPADFQDLLCDLESERQAPKEEKEIVTNVKVNPNLQLNVQVHIDPDTPDEKIEAIFKNMRKYLMGKEA
jgi:hypothetical protein